MSNVEEVLSTITVEQWKAIMAFACGRADGKEEAVQAKEGENSRSDKVEVTIQQRVTKLLHDVSCPSHIKGYRYLKEAVILTYEDETYIEAVTKALYPEVAKKFHTTGSRVERAIRHAMECMFTNGDMNVLTSVFTWNPNRDKPTNAEAIACMVEYLKELE